MHTLDKFKHIVITGASSGLGAELARQYAAPGVCLSLSGRDAQRLAEVVQSCRASGAQVHEDCIDVTDAAAMAAWLQGCNARQSVDLVIANAGISGGTGQKELEPSAQAQMIFDVNVTGVLNTINPLLPAMVVRGHGHIAIMSSLAGFRGFSGAPAYCASKAAVRVYGEALRAGLEKTGLCVSVICPGFVVTPMTAVNDFDMPLLMPVERAAAIIIKGLARGKGRIAFPFVTRFAVWALSPMPDGLAHRLIRDLPGKKSLK